MIIYMTKKLCVVFDLDKTIGYFTQIAMLIDGIEYHLNRKITIKEHFKIFDLFPEIFRPNIFNIFKLLKKLKKKNKHLKVIIYTNNMGPKSWTHIIKKYIEQKIPKLFDHVICAWKVGDTLYEPCRTTHNKTYKDLLNCTKFLHYKFCFIDDQYHPHMVHKNIKYLRVIDYKNDLLLENMIQRLYRLHFIINKNALKTNILLSVDNNKYGYKYTRKTTRLYNYSNELFNLIKSFVKINKKKKKTRKYNNRKYIKLTRKHNN